MLLERTPTNTHTHTHTNNLVRFDLTESQYKNAPRGKDMTAFVHVCMFVIVCVSFFVTSTWVPTLWEKMKLIQKKRNRIVSRSTLEFRKISTNHLVFHDQTDPKLLKYLKTGCYFPLIQRKLLKNVHNRKSDENVLKNSCKRRKTTFLEVPFAHKFVSRSYGTIWGRDWHFFSDFSQNSAQYYLLWHQNFGPKSARKSQRMEYPTNEGYIFGNVAWKIRKNFFKPQIFSIIS